MPSRLQAALLVRRPLPCTALAHAPCKPLNRKQVLLHQRVCCYILNLKAPVRQNAPCSGLQSPDAAVLRSRTVISRAWLVLPGRLDVLGMCQQEPLCRVWKAGRAG